MKVNDKFQELEQMIVNSRVAVKGLNPAEKAHMRPDYQGTPPLTLERWSAFATPIGLTAVILISLLTYFSIRKPIDTLPAAADVTVAIATASLAVLPNPTATQLPDDPPISAQQAKEFAVDILTEATDLEQLEAISAEIITPVQLAYDAQSITPNLPDRFWAVTVQDTGVRSTTQCSVFVKEALSAPDNVIAFNCNEAPSETTFSDDYIRTQPLHVIAQSNQNTQNKVRIRDTQISESTHAGHSLVNVTLAFEYSGEADGLLALHWGYMVTNEAFRMGDLVAPLTGSSSGHATVQLEVSNELISNNQLTGLHLEPYIRSQTYPGLDSAHIIYLRPETLTEYQEEFSPDALQQLALDFDVVHRWQDVVDAHNEQPIDILFIHYAHADFPTFMTGDPRKDQVDADFVARIIQQGTAIVGMGTPFKAIRTNGQQHSGPGLARFSYSLTYRSASQVVEESGRLLFSRGWEEVLIQLEQVSVANDGLTFEDAAPISEQIAIEAAFLEALQEPTLSSRDIELRSAQYFEINDLDGDDEVVTTEVIQRIVPIEPVWSVTHIIQPLDSSIDDPVPTVCIAVIGAETSTLYKTECSEVKLD